MSHTDIILHLHQASITHKACLVRAQAITENLHSEVPKVSKSTECAFGRYFLKHEHLLQNYTAYTQLKHSHQKFHTCYIEFVELYKSNPIKKQHYFFRKKKEEGSELQSLYLKLTIIFETMADDLQALEQQIMEQNKQQTAIYTNTIDQALNESLYELEVILEKE